MKLNGWQRVGIVASVVWFLGAYNYELSNSMTTLTRFAADDAERCYSPGGVFFESNVVPCDATMHAKVLEDLHEMRKEVAIVVAVWIPLAWGFAYLALFLVRWVRRGFV
jgi:hypothetical protein